MELEAIKKFLYLNGLPSSSEYLPPDSLSMHRPAAISQEFRPLVQNPSIFPQDKYAKLKAAEPILKAPKELLLK